MSPKSQVQGCLAAALPGATVRITGVVGGVRAWSRLVGMGLITGTCVDVRSNNSGGPVLVAVGHARIALGRAMAERVLVELVGDQVGVSEKARRSA